MKKQDKKEVKFTISTDQDGILRINGNMISQITNSNGIISIDNGSTGGGHSCHPNIDVTGSVKGMIKLGHWSKDDEIVKSKGCYYNKSRIFCSDVLDKIAYALEYENQWDLVKAPAKWTTEERTFLY